MKQAPLPLLLSASRASWAVSSQHGTEWENHKVLTTALRDRVFSRDDHTCQACGWRSDRFQEIHHRDDDHRNHDIDNLQTLCPLCHQVFHLPVAAATNGGAIVWLPECSQTQINLMCIGLFVAMRHPSGKYAGTARLVFSTMESRKTMAHESVGSSDPGLLAQALINLPPQDYAKREASVGSLRLLPYASRFETQVDYWMATAFKDLPETAWEALIEGVDVAGLTTSA